ncbi:MAG TPA: dienelactone hydrolase family protein, partial [Candidatus Sulfomarinibacteraceae bacterium]|nr:dienelactone hydrolase family protein [Candidatus Sulfomarinibacteraceae bacterium]
LALADELPPDLGFTFVAPGASATTAHPRSWYPSSFLAPVEANEPGLSSALAKIERTVLALEAHGIAREDIILLGFSQGACLAVEYAVRHARRWGGVAALTGGLIGESIGRRDGEGGFEGTPIFLGCSDRDPHVPLWRVSETEEILRRMGAEVEKRVYPGMAHTIIRDELDWVETTMRQLPPRQRRPLTADVGTPSG